MHIVYVAITVLTATALAYAASLNFVGAESVRLVADRVQLSQKWMIPLGMLLAAGAGGLVIRAVRTGARVRRRHRTGSVLPVRSARSHPRARSRHRRRGDLLDAGAGPPDRRPHLPMKRPSTGQRAHAFSVVLSST